MSNRDRGRRTIPPPWPLVVVILSLGLLALISLGVGQVNLPGWMIVVVQVVWLVATGVLVVRQCWLDLQYLRGNRQSMGEPRWRAARYMTQAAMVFGVFAMVMALALLTGLFFPAAAEGISVAAYALGAGGMGLTILGVSQAASLRGRRR